MHRYFILNKPANIVSQFVSSHQVPLLGDLSFEFPSGTHAIGRLDKDSEGLLLLTTDKSITRLMFSSGKLHERTYLVMVQNEMSRETLKKLENGVTIKIKNGAEYIAKPRSIQQVIQPENWYHFAKDPRETFPHTWLLMTLTEGKFRQVRKMVMALGHRCLRLIRVQIEDIGINGLAPGEVKELDKETFFQKAGLS